MSLFKCKMCGGDLEVNEGITIAECEYCGTKQTVPKALDENLQNLFNRANTLRIKSEFDKAEKLYEKIIQADTTQAEAYWGLILCKYGIEYVDDPATFKKIPTCHRASYDSIIADDDYKSAIENADMSQRAIYEEQAKEIDRIQKDILALAQKEETYDVFICYKETDADGKRTRDSVIANDIYYQLTQEGFKVFYAAITLEGKLGSAYEPIIFAALNSAKVMLSIGTKPEYFNAVWVKNEWSRFLQIIKKDRSKLLIPCYRDMDAYDLPDEFAHLQAQDMGKIGFINDLVRGIKKITTVETNVTPSHTPHTTAQSREEDEYNIKFISHGGRRLDCIKTIREVCKLDFESAKKIAETPNSILANRVNKYEAERIENIFRNNGFEVRIEKAGSVTITAQSNRSDTSALIKRIFMFLEDEDWKNADEYCEKVLDIDPECAEAYLGKLLAELKVKNCCDLSKLKTSFENNNNYIKLIRFADDNLKDEIEGYLKTVQTFIKEVPYLRYYNTSKSHLAKATSSLDYFNVAERFKELGDYKDAPRLYQECCEKAEKIRAEELQCNQLFEEYKAAIENKQRTAELDKEISKLNEEHNALIQLKNDWQGVENELFSLNEKSKSIQSEIISSTNEMYSLGLLAFKRKKELSETIDLLEAKQRVLTKEIKSLQERKCGYNQISSIDTEINIILQRMENQNKKMEELSSARSNQTIRDELMAFGTGKKLLQNFDYWQGITKGSYINFGTYKQDDTNYDDKEDIEWLVLDVKDGKALLISKYGLDFKPYNATSAAVTWETCTLRKWLNNNFINNAFSDEEKASICTVTVAADKNPKYNTNPGHATQDKMFLLSITEFYKHFAVNTDENGFLVSKLSNARCTATPYAEQCWDREYGEGRCSGTSDGGKFWSRSPGSEQNVVANIANLGRENLCLGNTLAGNILFVRPAMWIDINYLSN